MRGGSGERKEGVDEGEPRYQKASEAQAKADKREKALRDAVVETMRKAGVDVSMDAEEGQRVLDEANGKAREMSFGEAYGYTLGGKIYIDPRIANAETPVHEYAHLWATALRKGNTEEWKNVVGMVPWHSGSVNSPRRRWRSLRFRRRSLRRSFRRRASLT